jgi:hypothetical protein
MVNLHNSGRVHLELAERILILRVRFSFVYRPYNIH